MSEIYIKVSTDPYSYCDEYTDPTLQHETFDLKSLFQSMPEHDLLNLGFANIDASKGNISNALANKLRDHGWVHLKTVKNALEKKSVEQVFFLYNPDKTYAYRSSVEEIDINNLTSSQIEILAKGGRILQGVRPQSILPSSQYKKLQTQRKRNEEAAEKKRISKEKREAKRKQKEIEEAKKLLQENGELK